MSSGRDDERGPKTAVGQVGIWSVGLRDLPSGEAEDTAAELDELGYGALWIPGALGGDVFSDVGRFLRGSERIAVATGIASVWAFEPASVASVYQQLENAHPDRFILGLGVSHREAVDPQNPGRYEHPYTKMAAFLDEIEKAEPSPPRQRIVLAALGPRMLALAGSRAGGAFPYFVPVEHTFQARVILGEGPLLVTALQVILDTDRRRALETAHTNAAYFLGLANYANNLLRLGFTEADLEGGGSDRLLDAIVAVGDLDAIARRVHEHFEAGANHVCLQVLTNSEDMSERQAWKELATALLR